MLGRPVGRAYPDKRLPPPDAPVALAVEGLTAPGVQDATLTLRAGEIVGLAGLVGAGRSELARAIYGATTADVRWCPGRGLGPRPGRPGASIDAGVAMIPESRKDDGLILRRPIRENVSLTSLRRFQRFGFVHRGAERAAVRDALERVTGSSLIEAPAGSLSGGNQQKLLFARALLIRPGVLIADEPTRGIDVGAKRDIYDVMVRLAADGMAILLISNEVEEILGLAHRVARHARGTAGRRAGGSGHDGGGHRERRVRHDHHDRRMSANTIGTEPTPTPLSQRAARIVGRAGILIPFLIAFVVLTLISPPFLRFGNLTNILDQQAGIIIVACAGTFVLIAGGIDLSIGAIYGLAGAVALTTASSVSPVAGILAGLGVGLAVGIANGVIVTQFRINPLIGTLAMTFVVSGIAAIVTKGNLVVALDHLDFQSFAATKIVGISSAAWIMIVIAILAAILLESDDVRAVRLRDRREHPGGPPRWRPHQRGPDRDVRPERDGGRAGGNARRLARPERPGEQRAVPDVHRADRHHRRRDEHPRWRGHDRPDRPRLPLRRAHRQRLQPARARSVLPAGDPRCHPPVGGRCRRLVATVRMTRSRSNPR